VYPSKAYVAGVKVSAKNKANQTAERHVNPFKLILKQLKQFFNIHIT
jgi:hypothetical protein